MRKIKWSRFLPVIGLVLFAYIVLRVGIDKLIGIFQTINIYYFIFAFSLSAVLIILKTMKWKLIIESQNIDYPFSKCLFTWLVGNSASLITPGRIGDLYRAFNLEKYANARIGNAVATVILDRFLDIVVMITLIIIGILFLGNKYGVLFDLMIPVLLLFLILLIIISLKSGVLEKMSMKFFYRLVPKKIQSGHDINLNEFFTSMQDMFRKRTCIFGAILLSLIAWAVNIFQFYLLTLAFNMEISFLYVAYMTIIICLVELIPISISGIGTRDAALIFLLSAVHVPAVFAISLSISMLFIIYSIGFVGLLIWLREKKFMANDVICE